MLEDLEAIEAARIVADRACGWNGSLTPYVHEQREGVPCPPMLLQRLRTMRDAAAQRAVEQRRRGLIG